MSYDVIGLAKGGEVARTSGEVLVVALLGVARVVKPLKGEVGDKVVAMGSNFASLLGWIRYQAEFHLTVFGDGASEGLIDLAHSSDEDLGRVLLGDDDQPDLSERTNGELTVLIDGAGYSQLVARMEEKAGA
jgi:hypothetical protein